jgi:hypothetical protein
MRISGISMVAFLVAAAFASPTAGAAHAGVQALSCTGGEHATYAPALTNTSRNTTITVSDALGTAASPGVCVDIGNSITSGTASATVTRTASCDELGAPESGTRVFSWNGGGTSTFGYTREVIRADATTQIVFTGTITAGVFAGDTAVLTLTVANTALAACAGAGLATIDYLAAFVVTS